MATSIYHITHLSNLKGILENGGLFSDARIKADGKTPTVIGHRTLKTRRLKTSISCYPGAFLGNFVPFYFCFRSPMLLQIHTGRVEDYHDGQESIIYLVSSAERIAREACRWCFTDGHAVEQLSRFYTAIEDLDRLDWQTIRSKYWARTDEDPDRQRRKQAEFLVEGFVPWECIEQVAVHNRGASDLVRELLETYTHQPEVKVQNSWYYR